MARELARRGDLVLMEGAGEVGLYRENQERELWAARMLDADEWWWVLHCAAPLAVRACPRVDRPALESDEPVVLPAGPEQAVLPLDEAVV